MANIKVRGNTQIIDATIENAQISASAAIAYSKLATLAGATGRILVQSASGFVEADSAILSSNIVRKDADNVMAANIDIDFGGLGGKITGLPTPTAATDAATKSYVDSVSAGLDPKEAVRLATAAALPAATYANGTGGVGATLTADANGALSVDGVAVAVSDRILVKNQAAALENGIYVVTAAGSGGTPFVLTRATDFDGSPTNEVNGGEYAFVTSGSTNADTGWVVSSPNTTATIGTDSIVFSQFSAGADITASNGLTKVVNDIQLDLVSLATTTLAAGDFIPFVDVSDSNIEKKIAFSDFESTLSLLNISGTLPVTKGGTGLTSVTLNNLLVGNGTSALTSLAPGVANSVLVSDGTAPLFSTAVGLSDDTVNPRLTKLTTGGSIGITTTSHTTGINITTANNTVGDVTNQPITITGGNLTAGTGFAATSVNINAGNATNAGGSGGQINLTTGSSSLSSGGMFSILTGNGGGTSSGGSIMIQTGEGPAGSGNITLNSGTGNVAGSDSGDITIVTGPTSDGAVGDIILATEETVSGTNGIISFRVGGSGAPNEIGNFELDGLDLRSGKTYQINDVSVLSSTTLGSGVTGSSLTSVGTLTIGTWNATPISVAYGGTGLAATPTNGQVLIGNGTNYTLSTLTAGTGISITNGAGSITITSTVTGLEVGDFVTEEVPTGTINGINDTFTLANTPSAGTVRVYKNGLRQRSGSGNDYTISGSTITFETGAIPQTGDILVVDYIQ